MLHNAAQILIVFVFIFLAGMFAGAETGMYRLSRLRLRLGVERERLSFVVLSKLMHDSGGFLLSMLAGTNLAHYLAASIVTMLLLSTVEAEHSAELFATLITAPVLFVLSELIPKNIFFYRADSLMPSLATVLYVFHKFFVWSGIVPLLRLISRIFGRLTGASVSAKTVISDAREHHIRVILQETREEGFLSSVQSDIINRIVSIPHIRIRSVMTPISKAQMVSVDTDRSTLLSGLQEHSFTRLPVYDGSPANVTGFVNIYEALCSSEEFTNLRAFVKPIRKLAVDTNVTEAINIMQSENERIVLVMGAGAIGKKRPIGIVTMKDLVEELLGELVEW